jgi:hypothetical protein
MTIKNVITKDERNRIVPDKCFADDKGLGQTFWTGLLSIGKREAQLRTVIKKFSKPGQITRC